MGTNNRSKLRIVLSAAALLAAGAHMLTPTVIPDAITLGLLLLAIVPWLSPIIESIDVPGEGRLELQVQEVQARQATLRREVDESRFLVAGFVNDWDFAHLDELSRPGRFEYTRGPNRDDRFVSEIVRLRGFALVSNQRSRRSGTCGARPGRQVLRIRLERVRGGGCRRGHRVARLGTSPRPRYGAASSGATPRGRLDKRR